MTRPNYSTDVADKMLLTNAYWVYDYSAHDWVIHTDVSSYNIPNANHSEEVVTGVSRRKPKGWIPPTGYTLYHRQYSLARGSAMTRSVPPYDTAPWIGRSGCIGGAPGNHNSQGHFDGLCSETFEPPGLEARSLIAARNKLKSQKVNLGNAYGERKQIAHQLGDTATRLARAARQLKHADWRGAMRSLGLSAKKGKPRGSNWTDHWLALQYGWKPLLSDIYGAADALSKRPKSDWIVTAKGFVKQKDVFTATWIMSEAGHGVAEIDSMAMTRIDAQPQNEATISLASFGILNPLEVAWEVTPWSFVVDWVYPIGDWLNSLDALLGYTNAYSSTSVYQKMVWTGTGGSYTTAYQQFTNRYSERKRVVRLRRGASSDVPIPSMPPLKDGRSLGHMANGLALLSQAFGRSPRGLKTPPASVGKLFLARYGTV